jgi:hypothetical protein
MIYGPAFIDFGRGYASESFGGDKGKAQRQNESYARQRRSESFLRTKGKENKGETKAIQNGQREMNQFVDHGGVIWEEQ